MKLAKSLLLGAAAGLAAVSGASAADLGVKKPTPVEYVRVCPAYGAGYFYIPGTETCLAIGGRVRAEYRYIQSRARNSGNQDSGFRALARLNVDTRTQTEIGVLRAFFRIEVARRTGSLRSGTAERQGSAFGSNASAPVGGIDSGVNGRSQQFVNVDKAFIQFSGLGGVVTAGRVQSFFDFYAHDLEWYGGSAGSDLGSTTAFAYTATFGGGFSATIAIEDPIERRNGIIARSQLGSAVIGANGIPGQAFVGQTLFGTSQLAYGNSRVPDVVGALQYDAAFGSLKLTGALHQVNVSRTDSLNNLVGGVGVPGSVVPASKYGFGVQAGAKFNLPFLAAGDVLWLQASYSEGAASYTGASNFPGSFNPLIGFTSVGNAGSFPTTGGVNYGDATFDLNGKVRLTKTFAATAAFLHYWTPQLRQGVFGSYSRTRTGSAGTIGFIAPSVVGGIPGIGLNTNPLLPQFQQYYVGSNLIYSPVKGLDIGVEANYQKLELKTRIIDTNRFGRTIKNDDQLVMQARVQRDF